MRVHVPECESTQTLLDASMPEWSVATTDHQTVGRGRLGRTWEDAPGTSLLCSVLVKPPAGRHPAELTLVAGVAVALTVEHELGRAAQIKWPNDVLVDGAKVSGSLGELRDGAVILGIGVNVNQTRQWLPPDGRVPATSLRIVDGRERELPPLVDELLARLKAAYEQWLAGGLGALHTEIGARDFLRGREVTVNSLTGTVVGIRPDGRLELDNGVVESGEVLFASVGEMARDIDVS